jgi:hypothetical protein
MIRKTFGFLVLGFLAGCSSSSGGASPDGGTSQPDAATADDSGGGVTSQVVGAGGGTVSAPDGTQVVIPAGALQSDVTITIALNESAPALTQAQSVAPAHVFGPEGQTFAKPVSVTLPFQPANLPSGATEKDLAVYTAPQGSSAYQALPTTIKDATHVTGQATHFSNMCPGAVLYDGGPLPDGAYGDAAVCTSLTPGAMVPLTFSDAGAPSLTGGTIASGTYDLTSITAYVPAGCTLNPGGPTGFSLTISFGSGTFEFAAADTGGGGTVFEAFSGTYSTSGSMLTLTDTCPDTSSSTAPYLATATQFFLGGPDNGADGGACGSHVYAFTLQ